MKKILLAAVLLYAFNCVDVNAQWCNVTTAIPYDADMPGITHFSLNTIDRTSLDLENYPSNSYVNTGMSTQLFKGQTYNVSITYTIDAAICPDMNLRIWIDFNHDGQLDDAGETVLSVNNQLPGTYNGTITIPANATDGVTRMRVTAKMSPNGGHILPSPCDDPPDPFGYHGEIEDYDVDILNTTGINSPVDDAGFNVYNDASGKITFSFNVSENSEASLVVFDIQGKMIEAILPSQKLSAGKYFYDLNTSEAKTESGIYFAVLSLNGLRLTKRIVVE